MAEHTYDKRGVSDAVAQCLVDSRRFLDAVRGSVVANDLEIRTSVACETPLHLGILRKIEELQPDLVIRCIETRGQQRHSALTPTDWQLLRSCPVPLMLTRGRTWSPVPRIVAALDLQPDQSAVGQRVLAAARYLSAGCGGALELVHSRAPDSAGDQAAVEAMRVIARSIGADAATPRLLAGAPEQTLPQLARDDNIDVMVLGALSQRVGAMGDAVGTLTECLIETLDCDFLLVRHGSDMAAAGAAQRGVAGVGSRVPA
jgi:universal stress protein E